MKFINPKPWVQIDDPCTLSEALSYKVGMCSDTTADVIQVAEAVNELFQLVLAMADQLPDGSQKEIAEKYRIEVQP